MINEGTPENHARAVATCLSMWVGAAARKYAEDEPRDDQGRWTSGGGGSGGGATDNGTSGASQHADTAALDANLTQHLISRQQDLPLTGGATRPGETAIGHFDPSGNWIDETPPPEPVLTPSVLDTADWEGDDRLSAADEIREAGDWAGVRGRIAGGVVEDLENGEDSEGNSPVSVVTIRDDGGTLQAVSAFAPSSRDPGHTGDEYLHLDYIASSGDAHGAGTAALHEVFKAAADQDKGVYLKALQGAETFYELHGGKSAGSSGGLRRFYWPPETLKTLTAKMKAATAQSWLELNFNKLAVFEPTDGGFTPPPPDDPAGKAAKYSDDQARDHDGRWTSGGGEAAGSADAGAGGTDSSSTIKGLPANISLADPSLSAERDALARGVFDAKVTGFDERAQQYDISWMANDVPANWETVPGRSGEKLFDPKYMELNSDGFAQAKDESLWNYPSGGEPGTIYRGMSYEEYQHATATGKLESLGGYNLSGQEGLTYYSSDIEQAASYANGFAPWQYAATPSRPAVVVAVKDPGGHVVDQQRPTEIGIRAAINASDITRVHFGHPVSVTAGKTEIRLGARQPTSGSRVSYRASVRWDQTAPKASKQRKYSGLQRYPMEASGHFLPVSEAGRQTGEKWENTGTAEERYRADTHQTSPEGDAWRSTHEVSSAMAQEAAAQMGLPGAESPSDPLLSRGTRNSVGRMLEGVANDTTGSNEVMYHGFSNDDRGRRELFVGREFDMPLTAMAGDREYAAVYGIREDLADQRGEPSLLEFSKGTGMIGYTKWSLADGKDHKWDEAITAGRFKVTGTYHFNTSSDWRGTPVKVYQIEQVAPPSLKKSAHSEWWFPGGRMYNPDEDGESDDDEVDDDEVEKATRRLITVLKYSPDEERDDHGRWTSGGGDSGTDTLDANLTQHVISHQEELPLTGGSNPEPSTESASTLEVQVIDSEGLDEEDRQFEADAISTAAGWKGERGRMVRLALREFESGQDSEGNTPPRLAVLRDSKHDVQAIALFATANNNSDWGDDYIHLDYLASSGEAKGAGTAALHEVFKTAAREGKGVYLSSLPTSETFYELHGGRKLEVGDGELNIYRWGPSTIKDITAKMKAATGDSWLERNFDKLALFEPEDGIFTAPPKAGPKDLGSARAGQFESQRRARRPDSLAPDRHSDAPKDPASERGFSFLDPKYSPDQSRDDQGRFAGGGGGGASGGASGANAGNQSRETASGELAALLKEKGGFSYQPIAEASPTSGYMLSILPNYSAVLDGPVMPEQIDKYIGTHEQLFRDNPEAHVGGWLDPDTGKIWLDVSIRETDLAKATELGKAHNQIAIWDIGNEKQINIGGTGKAAAENDPLRFPAKRNSGRDRSRHREVQRAAPIERLKTRNGFIYFSRGSKMSEQRGSNQLTVALEIKSLSNREFEGYGSVFGNVDLGGDIVMPGAFQKSLDMHRKGNTLPQMFWMHQPDKVPGKWLDMSEDSHGLYVKGMMAPTPLGDEIHTLLQMKAVRGLSIGYMPDDYMIDKAGNRLLKAVELWEVSPVSLAMNPLAQVAHVKSRLSATGEYVPTPREFERHLRSGGCSQRTAKILMSKMFDSAFETNAMSGSRTRDVEQADDDVTRAAKALADRFLAEFVRQRLS